MSDDAPITRREFDLYVSMQKDADVLRAEAVRTALNASDKLVEVHNGLIRQFVTKAEFGPVLRLVFIGVGVALTASFALPFLLRS